MRGIAASMVVVYHAETAWNPAFALGQGYSMLVRNGWIWVSYFFVLSGFVMMFAYGPSLARWDISNYRRFVIARFGRIYPLFAFTIAAMLAFISLGWTNRNDPWWTLIPNLLLVQGYTFRSPGWNVPAWSISTEWAVYLVFPLFVPFLSALGRRATITCTTGFAVAVAWLFVADVNSKEFPIERLVGCGLQFALGCCVYRLVDRGWWPRLNVWIASALAVLPVVLMALPIRLTTLTTFAVTALSFALSIAAMTRQNTMIGPLLRHSSLQLLGRISYSLYLNHMLVYLLARAAFAGVAGMPITSAPASVAVPLFLVYFAALVAVSRLTYTIIEEPARHWFKHRKS